jgi:hypothetical protein
MVIAIIPRFIIKRLFLDEINQIHANVLLSNILVIVLLVFWHNECVYVSSIPHFCIFQKILSIPCPGCGIIRSLFAIAGGNILSAWKYNPAGLFLFFYFLVQIPLRIMALKSHTPKVNITEMSQLGSKILISALFLVWIVRLTP